MPEGTKRHRVLILVASSRVFGPRQPADIPRMDGAILFYYWLIESTGLLLLAWTLALGVVCVFVFRSDE
jgi:hypothetical protein